MILQTGGRASGATSTRSRSASYARRSASSTRTMPTCSEFGPTRRTSGTRMRSLMRVSVLMGPPSSIPTVLAAGTPGTRSVEELPRQKAPSVTLARTTGLRIRPILGWCRCSLSTQRHTHTNTSQLGILVDRTEQLRVVSNVASFGGSGTPLANPGKHQGGRTVKV